MGSEEEAAAARASDAAPNFLLGRREPGRERARCTAAVGFTGEGCGVRCGARPPAERCCQTEPAGRWGGGAGAPPVVAT